MQISGREFQLGGDGQGHDTAVAFMNVVKLMVFVLEMLHGKI